MSESKGKKKIKIVLLHFRHAEVSLKDKTMKHCKHTTFGFTMKFNEHDGKGRRLYKTGVCAVLYVWQTVNVIFSVFDRGRCKENVGH